MEDALRAIALLQSDLISTQRRNAELQQHRRDQIEEQDLMAAAFRAKDEELASVMEQLALVESENRLLDENNSSLRAQLEQAQPAAVKTEIEKKGVEKDGNGVRDDRASSGNFGFDGYTDKGVLLQQLTRVYQLLEEERRIRFNRDETIRKQQLTLQELQDDLDEYAEVRAVRGSARRRRGQHVDPEPLPLPPRLGGTEGISLEVRMQKLCWMIVLHMLPVFPTCQFYRIHLINLQILPMLRTNAHQIHSRLVREHWFVRDYFSLLLCLNFSLALLNLF
jgi:hypothetical protein